MTLALIIGYTLEYRYNETGAPRLDVARGYLKSKIVPNMGKVYSRHAQVAVGVRGRYSDRFYRMLHRISCSEKAPL